MFLRFYRVRCQGISTLDDDGSLFITSLYHGWLSTWRTRRTLELGPMCYASRNMHAIKSKLAVGGEGGL